MYRRGPANKLPVGETILQRSPVQAKSRASRAVLRLSTLLPDSIFPKTVSLKEFTLSPGGSIGRSRLYCLLALVVISLLAGAPAKAQFVCAPPWSGTKAISGSIKWTADSSSCFVSTDNCSLHEDSTTSVVMYQTSAGMCAWAASPANTPDTTYTYSSTIIDAAPCSDGSPGVITTSLNLTGTVFSGANLNLVTGQLAGAVTTTTSASGTQTSTDTCTGINSSSPITTGAWAMPSVTVTPATLSGNQSFVRSAGGLTYNFVVEWNLSPVPDNTIDDPCHKQGSDIGCQNQSLGESIPVTGTPFFLRYQSDRAPGRGGADIVAIIDAQSMGGWTLSVHHVLELVDVLNNCFAQGCVGPGLVPKSIFLGDGSTRSGAKVQAPLNVNSDIYVTSESGEEVYVFQGPGNLGSLIGRHLQTLRPLTGAVVYTFGYDAAGRLVTVTDAVGNVSTITRDTNEHPTGIVSPYGQVTTLAVDANGYLQKITDPAGNATTLVTSASGLLQSLTDANQNTHTFQYDTYGRLTLDSDPAGGSVALVRTDSATGYAVAQTTALGRVTTYGMTFSGQAPSTTEQMTNTWPNGLQTTQSESQQLGALSESTTLPDGTSTSTTMGPDPRWGIQLAIPTSTATTMGSLTANVTASRTAVVATAGNPFPLTTQTDTATINGSTYQSVFSAASNTRVETSPVGRTKTVISDALERPVTFQVPGLADTALTYDTLGRPATVTQGTRVTTFAYDANGRLSAFTNPLGQTSSFAYDLAGNLLTKTLPDGRVIGFAYDAVGNLTSVTPPGGPAHQLTYSPINLVSSYLPPSGPGTSPTASNFTYNLDRQLTQVIRPDGNSIALSYDSAGRRTSVVTPTATIGYTYDATTGNLAGVSVGGGEGLAYTYNGPLLTSSTWTGTVAGSVGRSYDNNFRPVGETIGTSGAVAVSYGYDADGLLTSAQAGSGSMSLTRSATNGFLTATQLGTVADSFTYDQYGELTGYSAAAGSPLYSYTNTFDALGRVTARSETIGGTTTQFAYQYDLAGRLTAVSMNGMRVSEYRYDADSNRTLGATASGVSRGRYDKQDRMIAYGHAHYGYTANGELASKSEGEVSTKYTYDVLGNLTAVTISPANTSITYLIDGRNRRVGKKVNGMLTVGYLYDGRRLVAQLDANNALVSQFVYASGSTSPAFMIKGGVVYRILSDQIGSPRLIVNAATGVIAERIDYDEFGVVLNDTNPGFQPFGFAGGLHDQDTELVRFGARDYDPASGRWSAKDPSLFNRGDSNLYRYALSDPINRTDKSGLGTSFSASVYELLGLGITITIGEGHASLSIEGGLGYGSSVEVKEGTPWNGGDFRTLETSQENHGTDISLELFAEVLVNVAGCSGKVFGESKQKQDKLGPTNEFEDMEYGAQGCLGPTCWSTNGGSISTPPGGETLEAKTGGRINFSLW
jgi:RHS repeat-associated protein